MLHTSNLLAVASLLLLAVQPSSSGGRSMAPVADLRLRGGAEQGNRKDQMLHGAVAAIAEMDITRLFHLPVSMVLPPILVPSNRDTTPVFKR